MPRAGPREKVGTGRNIAPSNRRAAARAPTGVPCYASSYRDVARSSDSHSRVLRVDTESATKHEFLDGMILANGGAPPSTRARGRSHSVVGVEQLAASRVESIVKRCGSEC